MIFPYQLEDSRISRIPWASIGLVVLIFVGFFATGPGGDDLAVERAVTEMARHLKTHPDLVVPPDCQELLPTAGVLRRLKGLSPVAVLEKGGPPSGALLEQGEGLCAELLEAVHGGWRSWALVPARGVAQAGWLTSLFLHAGWLHLLGNLFFFVFLVGPFLEDVWGWKFFLGFYLLGGIFAGIAQALMSWGSEIPILGASGAIAACMGAFTLRFSQRRVKFFYWLYIRFYGTFLVPAWAYGIFWIASEIWSLWILGDGAGIAFMAHIGGFFFGLGTAVALRFGGLEERFIVPALEKEDGLWRQAPGIALGLAALAAGNQDEARAAFEKVAKEDPTNADAHLSLARLDFGEGRDKEGTRRLDGVFSRWLARQEEEQIQAVIDELHEHIEAEALRPALAYRLAKMEEAAERYTAAFAFLCAVGASGTTTAQQARLEAAEMAMGPIQRPHLGRQMAAELLGPKLDPSLRPRVEAILEQTGGVPEEGGAATAAAAAAAAAAAGAAAAAVAAPAASPASSQLQVLLCRVVARTEAGPRIKLRDGREARLAWKKIKGVAVTHLDRGPDSGPDPLPQLVVDLITGWGGPGVAPSVIRICDPELRFAGLFEPAPEEPEAVAAFLREVLEHSGAGAWPSAEAVTRGPWPIHPDLETFEAAVYRRRSPASGESR